MAHIPNAVLEKQKTFTGLHVRHRGKVRDSCDLPDHPDKMLVVASDRCSIFDFVLPTLVPLKGQILTALNHFWTTQVLNGICETDFIAAGADIDAYVPEKLRGNIELQKRATVVRIHPSPEKEDIVRLYLTGSGWASYQKNLSICGHRLMPGLLDGNKLPYPLYTPSDKAVEGHDEHINADYVAEQWGFMHERLALQIAGAISAHAEKCGIILADTKFEITVSEDGCIVLVDEKGTPDSSRFWDSKAWKKAQAKGLLPPSLDKQYVRKYGKDAGIDKLDPSNPEHLAIVDNLCVPSSVTDMTTRIYRYIFWRLTGMQIEVYQNKMMGMATSRRKPRVEIVIGSESDRPQTTAGLDYLDETADYRVSVISCHRNKKPLRSFSKKHLIQADIVIAGAGMAAALPGDVKSELCMLGHPEIPVIGVAFKGQTEDANMAAKLCIEQLPESPVELTQNGTAYFGKPGFHDACIAAVEHEFLPKAFSPKPAKIGRFN